MTNFKYLVFSGGGAAGYAYSGALQELGYRASFSFKELKACAGASVGSLAALMVALDYSPFEASQKLANINLKNVQDGGCFIAQGYRLMTRYGKYKGKFLYDLITDIIKEKTNCTSPENFTFADLKALGYKDLYIVATKLYKKNGLPVAKRKIFSYETTPETSIAAAIYASTAAPIYFPRVRLKKLSKTKYVLAKEGDLYSDGGLLDNFPIDIFDKPKYQGLPDDEKTTMINPHTLGLAVRRTEKIEDEAHVAVKTAIGDYQPIVFGKGVYDALLYQFNHEKLDVAENRARTIQIDKIGVTLNDFDMSEKTKLGLIESGRKAVQVYFAAHPGQVLPDEEVLQFSEKKVKVGKLWEQIAKRKESKIPERSYTPSI